MLHLGMLHLGLLHPGMLHLGMLHLGMLHLGMLHLGIFTPKYVTPRYITHRHVPPFLDRLYFTFALKNICVESICKRLPTAWFLPMVVTLIIKEYFLLT